MATLILKATEKCNSNCRYCDVVRKKKSGGSMSLEILELVFRRIGSYLETNADARIEIIWHGGEPLLLGAEYYHNAYRLQQTYCSGSQDRITHAIQSNLTCLTPAFLKAFKLLGITAVGTSYDPHPHMRGPGEQCDSEKYNRRFFEGIALLERSGLGWGVIYVVTKDSLKDPVNLFYFLTNLKPTGGVSMNPVLIYDQERRHLAISAVEYADFLGTIFPEWWAHRRRYPDVQPFKGLYDNIIEKRHNLCCAESGRCSHDYINIAPGGELSHCGRSGDWELLDYGHLSTKSFDEVFIDPQRITLRDRAKMLHEGECRDCRFFTICHGGCPLDAYSLHGDFLHKSEWCQSRKHFIERYFEPITGTRFSAPPEWV